MAEIDSLGSNYYYSGVQNATNEAIKRNTKKEEVRKSEKGRRLDFGKLLKGEEVEEPQFIAEGLNLPPEVMAMSIDEAAVFLADAVSLAGNDFSDEQSKENLEKFKSAVSQFIRFVIVNNFEVNKRPNPKKRGAHSQPSRLFFFSDYTVPKTTRPDKISIEIINQKLDALARETLSAQSSNLKILAQVNEIKGLIVDLMSS